jgi:allantoate deiminase
MLAAFTSEPGWTTRTFLSEPMRQVYAEVGGWMSAAGMTVRVDPAGNLRGVYPGTSSARRLYIGSHLDTVPHAGPFDGILGVVAGVALVEQLAGQRLPFALEVVGFADEEGVRFGVPFIGSRGFTGTLDESLLARRDENGVSVADAIRTFGAEPWPPAAVSEDALGWVELHIEQGPVLERLGLPLGIVDAIAGQTRLTVTLTGATRHAGTTPMENRRDALAGAAEWIVAVEHHARETPGLVATVGRVDVEPGATNAVAGRCDVTLDVRHAADALRVAARDDLMAAACAIATRRRLDVSVDVLLEQPTVPMDPALTARLASAVERAGHPTHHMPSGAGHDAMIVATSMPAAMLFVRSPGGISHHPDETVLESDVDAALRVLRGLLDDLASSFPHGTPRG